MSKEKLRKKLINLRKANFTDQGISFIKFNSILKKLNFNKNINIGGYYPINSEIGCLDILEKLEKNNFKEKGITFIQFKRILKKFNLKKKK